MNEHDPPPLTDAGSGAPPLLRDALVTARAQAPSAAQLAALAGRLPLGGPPPSAPPPGGPSGAAPAAAAPPSVLSGALIGAALGVLVSGTGLWLQARGEPAPRVTAPRVTVTAPAEMPRPVTEARDVSPVHAPPPATAAAAASALRPAPIVASASAAASTAAPSAEPEPASGSVGVMTGPAGPADTETEAHFLQRAQDALATGPAQALALAEAHASRFPAGTLGQEREVVAIQALVRLGRVEEARARGGRFLAAFPGSAHRRRLEALLGP